jgi:hypothetical protein
MDSRTDAIRPLPNGSRKNSQMGDVRVNPRLGSLASDPRKIRRGGFKDFLELPLNPSACEAEIA